MGGGSNLSDALLDVLLSICGGARLPCCFVVLNFVCSYYHMGYHSPFSISVLLALVGICTFISWHSYASYR